MISVKHQMYDLIKSEYLAKKDISLLVPPIDVDGEKRDKRIKRCIILLYVILKEQAKEIADFGEHRFSGAKFICNYSLHHPFDQRIVEFYEPFSFDCNEWIYKTLYSLYPEMKDILGCYDTIEEMMYEHCLPY